MQYAICNMQCNAIQCNAMQCNAMQCNAMQYNAMQYNAIQCNAMQYNLLTCNLKYFFSEEKIILHVSSDPPFSNEDRNVDKMDILVVCCAYNLSTPNKPLSKGV